MKYLKLYENIISNEIYTFTLDSDIFSFKPELEKKYKCKKAFSSRKDITNFIINIINDLKDDLINFELIDETPTPDVINLDTVKKCNEFFKNLHKEDNNSMSLFEMKFTFDVQLFNFELEENIDTPEEHQMKKTANKYNL